MPELPEVETTMQGLKPHLINEKITKVIIRQNKLRWPVSTDLKLRAENAAIKSLSRRGKYLLLHLDTGIILIHLGMSGNLRFHLNNISPQKHDHVDFILGENKLLRYTDPRRFGCVLWQENNLEEHSLLSTLGVEPLEPQFTGKYLYKMTLKRRVPIKSFIMNSKIVVGVGNIYAAEALFLSGIHPLTPANHLSETQCESLVSAIKKILQAAILQGGTTLKDFLNSAGKPGYFKQQLKVYGRGGASCVECNTALQMITIAQRSTVFCEKCQVY